MITPDQVEDWIREVQERPPSAAAILRAGEIAPAQPICLGSHRRRARQALKW
jgi:hypothetical protein